MEQMINSLGFPIACVCALGWFANTIITRMLDEKRDDRTMYMQTIDKFDDKLDKFSVALENNNSKLGMIEEDIRVIKNKVGV